MKKILLFTCVLIISSSVTNIFARGNSNSDEFKVAVTVGDLANPFFYTMGRGAETKIKELVGDNATVTLLSSSYDLSRQVSQIDNFIASDTLQLKTIMKTYTLYSSRL